MFQRIYLDNSATTPISPEVLEAMMPYLTSAFGNASSIHHFGQEAKGALDNARHQVARLIKARPNEVYFTSGGTESNNLAVRGLIETFLRADNAADSKPHIITSEFEHPAIKSLCQDLEEIGVEVTYLPVNDNGVVRVDDVQNALRENTVLISIMTANNETGTIQPVAQIGAIVKGLREAGRKIYFHTDAVQAAGKMAVDVDAIGCDMLSISGHKINAPKGVGAIYIRRNVRLHQQNIGGKQERGKRGGTESVPLIVALGKAAEIAEENLTENNIRLKAMRDRFESSVIERIADTSVNGDIDQRIPNISNLSFRGIEGEGLLINLDMRGVAVSTGSACSSGSIEPSPVILALGRDEDNARGAVRFSFGIGNTEEEVDRVLEILPEAVENLRRLNPAYTSA